MTAETTFSRLRTVTLGTTGLICLAYALLALAQGRGDPMPWWVPGLAGGLSTLAIFAGAALAGRKATQAASDELHRLVDHKAQRHAYWVSLAVFVVFAVLSGQGVISPDVGFAVIGTSMGAAYLLLFVFYEWRMG